jgi:hypothetical protein
MGIALLQKNSEGLKIAVIPEMVVFLRKGASNKFKQEIR